MNLTKISENTKYKIQNNNNNNNNYIKKALFESLKN